MQNTQVHMIRYRVLMNYKKVSSRLLRNTHKRNCQK